MCLAVAARTGRSVPAKRDLRPLLRVSDAAATGPGGRRKGLKFPGVVDRMALGRIAAVADDGKK
ncbi:hypothetical protein EV648_102661 [Kribbella sp. VKM Ac-2568]|nr:hypothetical protein EV648_102661 [Kribbella sp. VKM Ac-2568]